MKHPLKFFIVLFLILTAVAAAILMTKRYMDVLQRQFDFLRGLLARHSARSRCDSDFCEEFTDQREDEDEEEDDFFDADKDEEEDDELAF